MSETQTLSRLTDFQRISSLARNVLLCLEIKGLTTAELETDIDIPLGTIAAWNERQGYVLAETLMAVGAYFDIPYIKLLETAGPEDTRRNILKELLHSDRNYEAEAPLPNFARRRDADLDDLEDSLTLDTTRASRGQRTRSSEAQSAAPVGSDTLEWDDTGTIGTVNGQRYDLMKKAVRIQIANNVVRYNPHQKIPDLLKAARLDRKAHWFYNFQQGKGRIERNDLERIAEVCKVSVVVLLTEDL